MSTMTLAERRETLVNSLRASKSWTTGYAEAFVDDYVISTQPAQAVDVEAIREVIAEMRSWPSRDRMNEQADKLARAISGENAGPVGDGWQPIETAPKDGTRVLGYHNGRVDFFHWQDASESGRPVGWRDSFIYVYSDGPSHWMCIPASPAPDKEGEVCNRNCDCVGPCKMGSDE